MLDRTIRMRRPDLKDLPPIELPEGYSLRTAWPGFEETWVRIARAAFGEEDGWTVEKFREQLSSKQQFDLDGQFFVFSGDEPVAMAFAWLDEPDEKVWGRVHWVAVVPEHRGNGLGRAVVLAVMHYLAQRGFPKVFLDTQGYRQPAIRLYLSLGFRPAPRDEEEEKVWEQVMQEIRRRESSPR